MSAPGKSWRGPGAALAALVGACAVCCAGPLLAVLGGIGAAGLLGSLWVPALLTVVAIAAVGILVALRKRRRASCRVAQAGPVDLDLPTLGHDLRHH
ncbi:mercuric ion transport protein [Williamsia limnetica]|uniref:Mercuric ion transport protein n=1 Tax=Williamsia limnetica TaxID=882452 RepID=A0A318RKP0_WILLI|nr:hypothetical protein [Williamsia limnetica]PYE11742.1 mercuric ion transport protein [Williamsia limnetica]